MPREDPSQANWKIYRRPNFWGFICTLSGHVWQYDGLGWNVCHRCDAIMENLNEENRKEKPRSEK